MKKHKPLWYNNQPLGNIFKIHFDTVYLPGLGYVSNPIRDLRSKLYFQCLYLQHRVAKDLI